MKYEVALRLTVEVEADSGSEAISCATQYFDEGEVFIYYATEIEEEE